MKTLIIDNYDSFTFNLYQFVGELGGNPIVYRNDKITIKEVKELQPTHIVISPGPGDPRDERYFGICKDTILELGQDTPVLGVCLGHQGIGYLFGAKIVRAPQVMHGKTSMVTHNGRDVFSGIKSPIKAMRYHSLVVESIPDCLQVTATTQDGIVMGLRHKDYPIYGIQFHVESVGTPEGKKILKNFLQINAKRKDTATIERRG